MLSFFVLSLDIEDKITLVHSINIMTNAVSRYSERLAKTEKVKNIKDLTKHGYIVASVMMPICYNWKTCYYSRFDCVREHGCLVSENKEYLKMCIKHAIDFVFQIRNDFVHDAAFGMFETRTAIVSWTSRGPVYIELIMDDIEHIVEKAIINYFR